MIVGLFFLLHTANGVMLELKDPRYAAELRYHGPMGGSGQRKFEGSNISPYSTNPGKFFSA
jgi:hypothetical protein